MTRTRKDAPRILDPNQAFVGTEPNWTNVSPEEIKKNHRLLLIKTLNWYAANSESKEQLSWLKKSFPDIKADTAITIGPLCRMVQRGYPKELLWDRIEQLAALLPVKEEDVKTDKPKVKAPVVVDKVVESILEQIDYAVDDIFLKKSLNPTFAVSGLNKPQITTISEYVTKTLNEIDGSSSEKVDGELIYGITKRQENAIVGMLRRLLQQLQQAMPVVVRKPRKKKDIPVDRIVKGFTVFDYGTFKTLPATKIHGSSMALIFDSKTRRVSIFVAESGKTLSVKGKSIINFDETKSKSKVLRKPEDQLKDLCTGAKTNIMKKIDAIKAVGGVPKYRATETTTLLRIW